MGVSVQFYLGAPDGLQSLLLSNLRSFHDWYEELATGEDAGVFGIDMLKLANEILDEGPDALRASTSERAHLIDRLVETFVSDFAGWGPGNKLMPLAADHILHVRNYKSCLEIVDRFGSPRVCEWWRCLLNGRSIIPDTDSQISSSQHTANQCIISFTRLDEIPPLAKDLRQLSRANGNHPKGDIPGLVADALENAMAQEVGVVTTVS